MSKILVAGSTGLIGSSVAKQLTVDLSGNVILLSRRPFNASQAHHHVNVIDFNNIELTAATSPSDAIICALGTTIKIAGSNQAFEAVDLDMVINLATAAKKSGYQRFAVVSSIGATPDTNNFYLKTKGKMEVQLAEIGFDSLTIVRPSLLLGAREEFRLGEKIGEWASALLSPLFIGKLKKYRPVQASMVAHALIQSITNNQAGVRVLESDQINSL